MNKIASEFRKLPECWPIIDNGKVLGLRRPAHIFGIQKFLSGWDQEDNNPRIIWKNDNDDWMSEGNKELVRKLSE